MCGGVDARVGCIFEESNIESVSLLQKLQWLV